MTESDLPLEIDLGSFFGLDQKLPSVTTEAVTIAMAGYGLQLKYEKDMDWLAVAVRRALAITMPSDTESSKRKSNTQIRAELSSLARLSEATWLKLFQRSDAVENAMWWHASGSWPGDLFEASKDEEFPLVRFNNLLSELDWLARFLRSTADDTSAKLGPWRQSEDKRLRVQRGQYLAPIYEAAFGKLVSANNYPHDARHKARTPFMEFYDRMVTMAYDAREATNLAEVVKEACQLHRQHPARFELAIIPGL